jgi:hypothetical protein
MLTAFDYIYYRLRLRYSNKPNDAASGEAVSVLAVLQSFIVIDVAIVIVLLFAPQKAAVISKYWGILLYAGTVLFDWLRYRHEERFDALAERWQDEEGIVRQRRKQLVVAAYVISVAFPVIYAAVYRNTWS